MESKVIDIKKTLVRTLSDTVASASFHPSAANRRSKLVPTM